MIYSVDVLPHPAVRLSTHRRAEVIWRNCNAYSRRSISEGSKTQNIGTMYLDVSNSAEGVYLHVPMAIPSPYHGTNHCGAG